MHGPKKNSSKPTGIAVKIRPSALSLALIRQFAQCSYIEKRLRIPDNILFVN